MTTEDIPAGWSPLTHQVMRATAWHGDRRVPVDAWERAVRERAGLPLHDAARAFLAEFGGLRSDTWTPGPVMPGSPFRFDPVAALDHPQAAGALRAGADRGMYPVGLADGGDGFLGMTADGQVYIGADTAEVLADSAYELMEELVVGRRTTGDRPVPAPDGGRWSGPTEQVLRTAGWVPGRAVGTAEWERVLREDDEGFAMHEAARRFLAEFGGLEIEQEGPGRTMGRSPFQLDPLLARWDYEILETLGEAAGTPLYPLGMIERRNSYLTMAPDGSVYTGMDEVSRFAGSGDEALEKLILGIR